MRTEKIRKGFKVINVELYDSVNDITAIRNHYSNCYFLEDWGIGSDIESIGRHFSNLYKYIAQARQEEAYKEAKNLHNNLYFQIEKIDTKSLCFAPFVYTVGEKPFDDFKDVKKSQDMVSFLSENGLKSQQVSEILDSIKKKFSSSLEFTFLTDLELAELPIFIPKSKEK